MEQRRNSPIESRVIGAAAAVRSKSAVYGTAGATGVRGSAASGAPA